jgi:cytochrome P450
VNFERIMQRILTKLQTIVSVSHWSAYRSAANFSFPDTFIPERWQDDSSFENDKRDVLQPFNVGPRNCLGKK